MQKKPNLWYVLFVNYFATESFKLQKKLNIQYQKLAMHVKQASKIYDYKLIYFA